MHLSQPLRKLSAATAIVAVAVVLAAAAGAHASHAVRPAGDPASVSALRSLADHYRGLTWDYQRARHAKPTPTSFSYRRATDRAYRRWTVATWTRRAYAARSRALASIHRKLAIAVPRPPGLRASRYASLRYSRRLALRLRRIYPGNVTRAFADARRKTDRATLRLWQDRGARAVLAVALHAKRRPRVQPWLADALRCIHGYEGDWTANTGNGYYGGLQMDGSFMDQYGSDFERRWGTADNWPAWAQIEASARAYRSGRGFWPWPNTARACGLL
ncbi:MAG: hypothetical protein ACRDM1_15650 [Gaiellaceae bacterium]